MMALVSCLLLLWLVVVEVGYYEGVEFVVGGGGGCGCGGGGNEVPWCC